MVRVGRVVISLVVVVLLRPAASDEITIEALARVKGELTAALFDVVVVPQSPGLDLQTALQTLGRELDPIATFGILRGAVGAPDPTLAEVWVFDRTENKIVIQRMRISREDPERGATVLAVQAVELLKASLAQFWSPPLPPPAVPGREGTVVAPAAPPSPPFIVTGLAVQAGVGWLQSFGPVGAVWQPHLRISAAGSEGFGGRLTLSGFGTKAEVAAAGGSARIDQRSALLELVKAFRPERRLQIVASGGIGFGVVHVEGTAIAPLTDRSGDALSLLTGGGVSMMVALHRRLALAASAEMYLAWPHAMVRIDQTDAGRVGWPALLIAAGLVGVL
jgi:hypothetical protein